MNQTPPSVIDHLHNIVLGEKCFANEKFLVKPGMVYVPRALGQEMVIKIKGGKLFGVFNALNGMLPVLLQRAHPKAKIVCIEHFPFFVKHLTNMGFETYLYSDNNWKTMHFDAAVLNPPYNSNLDLEFIKSACKIADRVIAVHPAISTINRKSTKRYIDFKKSIDGHVSYIKLFNGNPVFGISLKQPCQIIDIDMTNKFKKITVEYNYDSVNGETHEFKSIFDVTKWGNIPEYYSLEKRILAYCETVDNCENHIKREDKLGPVSVNFPAILGDVIRGDVGTVKPMDFVKMWKDNFYTFLSRSSLNNDKKYMGISFPTKNEQQNAKEYFKTDFARFCLSILKNNAALHRGELSVVPYLPSYDKPWTKARLTKLFNITDAEWAFIEKVIPKYYD